MRNINKILIIKGSAQYDVLRDVCDELMRSFCSFGCIVTVIDLTHYSYNNCDLESFSKYDLIFSFDVIGIELYNLIDKPPLFWTFLVDPPFYLHERLMQIKGNVMVSCIDRQHVKYIDRFIQIYRGHVSCLMAG